MAPTPKQDLSHSEVPAITQVFEEQASVAALRAVGRRVARTRMPDADREQLRTVYRECLRALSIEWGTYAKDRVPGIYVKPASTAQVYALRQRGYDGDLTRISHEDASRALMQYRRSA